MAALTDNRLVGESLLERYDPITLALQLTATHIYAGAVCVAIAGKARPALAATAGQTLLGIAAFEYNNPGADKTWTPPMVFEQGVWSLTNSTTDPVVAADAGKVVYLSDDNTVHHTLAANDVPLYFKGFDAEGLCRCDVRNP